MDRGRAFPEKTKEAIKDNGWTPEADYTFEFLEDFDRMIPEQVYTNFLKARRDNLKDIKEFEVTEVSVGWNQAKVTVASRHVNNLATASIVNDLYHTLFGDSLNTLVKGNQSDKLGTDSEKVKTLMLYFLYQANFDNLLDNRNDASVHLSETPMTVGIYEETFSLKRNEEGHWVISTEDYGKLVRELSGNFSEIDEGSRSKRGTEESFPYY